MEMVPVVTARIVVAANAAADEDADAADAVAAAEAKAAVARVARKAAPWVGVRKAVGQRIHSLPKPHRCRRATVPIITTTVASATARTNNRVLRPAIARCTTSRNRRVSRRRAASRSSLMSHNRPVNLSKLVSHNRLMNRSRVVNRSRSIAPRSLSIGLRNQSIGRLSLSSGIRLLPRRNRPPISSRRPRRAPIRVLLLTAVAAQMVVR